MIRYTLGFLFNKDLSKVLLIHKLSPEWQKGKINGLGGKFEIGETFYECIVREVKEETALVTESKEWKKIGELHSTRWLVDIVAYVYKEAETDATNVEKQQIEWFSISNLPTNIMSNLSWLVPLCKDVIESKEIESVTITHTF